MTMQINYHDQHLDFIKGKINEINTALFKTELDPLLQLPNNIIQTLKVDHDGMVWFFTSFNGLQSQVIDRPFFAYLDYHQKSKGIFLQLSGKASIAGHEDHGLFSICNYTKGSYGRLILVKFKIMQAEYFETNMVENHSWAEKLKHTFSHLFQPSANRKYNFSE